MKSLVEFLSNEELKMIEGYIAYNVDNPTDTVYLLREWADKKKDLYKVFDNNFILEKDIEYKADEKEVKLNLSRIVSYSQNDLVFPKQFFDLAWDRRGDIDGPITILMEPSILYTNCFEGETFHIPNPKNPTKDIVIQHGCKPVKALAKIAEAYDLEGFEEFRIAHSMALNQKVLKGKLCISIHPLDYMTMSDNESGWSSCMSWRDSGCYRQGTVEMLNSPCVVVAYLKSDKDMRIEGSWKGWNNKKWRQLFICDPELITGIKAYPYQNYNLTKMVNNWLKELMEKAGYTYNDEMKKLEPFSDGNYGNEEARLYFEPMTHNMYNDFACEVEHFGYIKQSIIDQGGYWEFLYSGASECMCCGELDPWFESEGMLVCEDCLPSYQCSCCGDRYSDENDLYIVDDEYLCEYCYNENVVRDIFDEEHLNDNCYKIYLCNEDYSLYDDTQVAYVFAHYFNFLDEVADYFDTNKMKAFCGGYLIPKSGVINNEANEWTEIFESLDSPFEGEREILGLRDLPYSSMRVAY